MVRTLSLFLVLAPLTLFACGEEVPRVEREISQRTAEVVSLVDGNTAFALDLFQEVLVEESGNVFLSPYSASSALAMTYAGAAGQTATEMESVLHVGMPSAAFHAQFGALTRDLDGDLGRGYELQIANRLFGQTGFSFGEEFLATNANDYGAPLQELDIASDPEAARVTVNGWVADQTHDHIEELIAPGVITQETKLVLANAITFSGDWLTAFDEADTTEGSFTTPSGTVQASFMGQEVEHQVAWLDDVSVLRLPYVDDEVSMWVVLPTAEDGLAAVESSLSVETLDRWESSLGVEEVWVGLPRFELRTQLSLVPALKRLGMEQAFSSSEADFSEMSSGGLYISEVVHEAYVKVDEAGTEAAASTAVVMDQRGVAQSFVASHPFLFLIRDDLTGSVLFMGRVVDPS